MMGTMPALELFDAAVRERVRLMSAEEFQLFIVETRPPDEPQLQRTAK